MDIEDQEYVVLINGKVHVLRDDRSIYLGMNVWYRPLGTRSWHDTDFYGRASLIPGMKYEARNCPEGSMPGAPLTFWEKIRLFVSRYM